MLRRLTLTVSIVSLLSASVLASDAETSASASSNRFKRNGTATATAHYDGKVGFARTNTQSGQVNLARGVAVGIDKSGVSLSVSNAVAPGRGPAVATTFNLSIDRNGQISKSRGTSVSEGPIHRSATAGGSVSTGRHGGAATAFAAGKTDRFGRVQATSSSQTVRPARYVEMRRYPARQVQVHSSREVRRYRVLHR
jgi:hypothetical protein